MILLMLLILLLAVLVCIVSLCSYHGVQDALKDDLNDLRQSEGAAAVSDS